MGKAISKKIIDFKLVKVEKSYNQSKPTKYFYNMQVEGIEELLLVESESKISEEIIGMKVKYKLNEENLVSDFELI